MKKICFILLLCVANISFAQIKLQGVVKDSVGQPLELANVIAINQETSALESYAITNDKGKFILNLGSNGTYKVQASFIGMKTFETLITTKIENITRDFVLKADNALDEVELTFVLSATK